MMRAAPNPNKNLIGKRMQFPQIRIRSRNIAFLLTLETIPTVSTDNNSWYQVRDPHIPPSIMQFKLCSCKFPSHTIHKSISFIAIDWSKLKIRSVHQSNYRSLETDQCKFRTERSNKINYNLVR